MLHLLAGDTLDRRREGRLVSHTTQGQLRISDGLIKLLQKIGLDPVIGIDKRQKITAGGFHAGISRCGNPLILLLNDPNARVPGCIFGADPAACVGAAVIHQNQFPSDKSLSKDASHATSQVFLCLIDRDNNTYYRYRQTSHLQMPAMWNGSAPVI